MSDNEQTGVTVIVTERVLTDQNAVFEKELAAVISALMAMPGNLGVNVIRPEKERGTYHIISKFDTPEHLEAWTESETHVRWCDRKCDLTTVPTSTNTLSGLETWFSLPGPVMRTPPPKYKMAFVSWCAIFPIISLILLYLIPALSSFPLVIRAAVIAAVAIITMTYLMMPIASRIFSGWLYPAPPVVIADEVVTAPKNAR
ncbi:MAG: hypothetical protein GX097_08140 [Methanomicrobiales archaeon]|nr:hypothetical protein [Methanomicrobiales archaeon]